MTSLNVKLHDGQLKVFHNKSKFKVLKCGRRWGKTWLTAYMVLVSAIQKPNGRYFIISPSYNQTKIMWEQITDIAPKEIVNRVMVGDLFIELKNGSRIYAKSGDNPHVLRGYGLDGVAFDEAAYVKEEVWESVIEPALVDRNGWAIFISTPAGRNWFYDLYLAGIDPNEKDWQSFEFTTYDNPFIPKDYIEKKRKKTPELIFRQEYLAEFVDEGGMVFPGYARSIFDYPEGAMPGEFYVMGVDLGRHQDFTVIKVGKFSEMREVYTERFNNTDWDYIKERIRVIHNRYNRASIIIDSTGYGDPIYEDLAKEGLTINGVNLNTKTKPLIIENLQLMLQNAQIRFLDDDASKYEFGSYTYTILPSGHIRYEAPVGRHDDTVVSAALMAYGMMGGSTSAIGMFEEEKRKEVLIEDEIEDVVNWEEDCEDYERDWT